MPYKSAKQRRYMHARHPIIAKRWDAEYGGKVGGGAKSGSTKKRKRKTKNKKRG